MSSIGSRIRERRVALGMTADELAMRLGKNRATVYRYESDEIENFPVSVIGPLAEILDVSPGYLMGWEENEKPAAKKDNGLEEKFIELFSELKPEQQSLIIAQIRGILSER